MGYELPNKMRDKIRLKLIQIENLTKFLEILNEVADTSKDLSINYQILSKQRKIRHQIFYSIVKK